MAQSSIVLYENDFEQQNLNFVGGCRSNFVSQQNINSMYYGTATARSVYRNATFNQKNTAEILYHDDAETVYKNPQGIGGKYALAINYSYDRLSLTFKRSDMQTLQYFNLAFDMTAALPLNPSGYSCGVASTSNTPRINVKLYQHQTSAFNATNVPSTSFATQTLEGAAPGTRKLTSPASLVYNWKRIVAPFDISNITMDYLTVTFDLANSTYVALDNFYIDANVYALPITLSSFREIVERDRSMLAWEVANAQNFDRFIIEASTDSRTWVALDSVAYEQDKTRYTAPTHTQYNLYRLMLVDQDGSYTYSYIVKTSAGLQQKFAVFPNPTLGVFTVTTPNAGQLNILNNTGQVVKRQTISETTTAIDAQAWPPGMYILQLISDHGIQVEKLWKQ